MPSTGGPHTYGEPERPAADPAAGATRDAAADGPADPAAAESGPVAEGRSAPGREGAGRVTSYGLRPPRRRTEPESGPETEAEAEPEVEPQPGAGPEPEVEPRPVPAFAAGTAEAAAQPAAAQPTAAEPAAPESDAEPAPESVADAPVPPSRTPAPASVPKPASPADTGAGRLVGGRYRLVERLGFGGMGTVWRARDEVVDRDVAIKEPRVPEQLPDAQRETAYLRMQREARAAARIDHPSVVTVHDVVVEGDRPWIVMELVRGRSLAEVLEEGTLPPREAARIGLAVLGALVAAHEAGILHRDVKPANVLLGRYGRVVLTDFGIAQVEGEERLTETGAFIGSPEYIAPERVLGQRPGPESDLWSLGVVLYQALEGVSPFRRQTTPSTFQAILLADLPHPARSGPLAGLIVDVLRKEPSARIGAERMAEALRAASRPEPAAVRGADTRLLSDAVRAANGGRPSGDPAAPAPGPSGPATRVRALLPHGRLARTGLGLAAAVVAAAVVLLVVRPLGGGGLPSGWRSYEEKGVDATVAAPAGYVRSIADHEVTYTDPHKVFTITLTKQAGDKRSAQGAANDDLDWYRNGGEVHYSDTVDKADGRVTEAVQQGEDAARLDVKYVDLTDDDNPAMRELGLYVVSGSGDLYQLDVEMPAAQAQADEGRRIFEQVKEHLRLHAL